MTKTPTEEQFEEYRETLYREIVRLVSYVRLYRHLTEESVDYFDAMNAAPAFFSTISDALFTAIVLWSENLLGKRSERGLWNFLAFIENDRDALSVSELQRRRDYPSDHWMLRNREEITFETIRQHRECLQGLRALPSISLRRDKFHAHFDKEYFFDPTKLQEAAPLTWADLDEAAELAEEILNTYSAAYDGLLYEVVPVNADDVDEVLEALQATVPNDS